MNLVQLPCRFMRVYIVSLQNVAYQSRFYLCWDTAMCSVCIYHHVQHMDILLLLIQQKLLGLP